VKAQTIRRPFNKTRLKNQFFNVIKNPFNMIVAISLVILFCLIAIASRYRYYHQDSKSIYLMRRLPDRAELHRSCLVQPLLRVALVLVVMAVLLLIFYTVYMNQVPEECLQPNQWQKLWRWIL